MKKSEMESLLKGYCNAPDQYKKDSFIRSIRGKSQFEHIGFAEMLKLQARYISKKVWLVSLLLIIVAFSNIDSLELVKIELLIDIMPFFACFGIIEGYRSKIYGMSELERTTRFSATGTYFAKMAVIAITHFFTIVLLALITPEAAERGFLIMIARLLLPYIVTNIISMEAERTDLARDNGEVHIWIPFGTAAAVWVGRRLLFSMHVTERLSATTLMMLLLVLLIVQVIEVRKTVKLEGLVWN